MCGRYAYVVGNLGRWRALFKVVLEGMQDRYNIAPSSTVAVFTREGWRKMRWGLVPSWSKEPKTKYATFNARAESFTDKPMFRSSWKEERRCLIPLSGYYEWKKEGNGKTVYYVTSTLDEPLVAAGLWERWNDEENELLTCTIITTAAKDRLVELHHRMPVLLQPHQGGIWLSGSREEAIQVLAEPSLDNIRYYPVAKDVGNPRNQGSGLIQPIS